MINNITNVDSHSQQINVAKAMTSQISNPMPPIIGFRTPLIKEKATLRVKKFKRSDGIVIIGDIEEDYVDTVEDANKTIQTQSFNFFQLEPEKSTTKFLKECYVIDYILSPKQRCGLGTEAIKGLVEKAMFDNKIQGRIVTFSAPVWQESSPALFFYKLGFRFMTKSANEYMEECLIKKIPDIPPQIGMMYLPKANLHRLLRYGEKF